MKFTTLIIVDDDIAHTMLVERNLLRSGYTGNIIKLADGQALLDWIDAYKANPTSGDISPCIFLDINMPQKNGIETLSEIKKNVETCQIPVVMLTTSDSPDEIDRCYALGCNAYVVKPVMPDKFKEVVCELGSFLDKISPPHMN